MQEIVAPHQIARLERRCEMEPMFFPSLPGRLEYYHTFEDVKQREHMYMVHICKYGYIF